MGVSKASQAPGPPPNTQITLAEDSPALRKISAATSGAPHSGAIFQLLVLICKDINVPTISKYAPESANCIFPAALNYVLLWGRLVLVDPVLHKHHCGDVSTFRVSVPDPALVHLPSSARSYFPVPFSPFISLRQNLLTKKKAEILNSAQYFKQRQKHFRSKYVQLYFFYSKEDINAVLFFKKKPTSVERTIPKMNDLFKIYTYTESFLFPN